MKKYPVSKSMYNSASKPQTNRYKDMSYVNHQQKYPLELKGTMKKHSQPNSQSNIKAIINYDAYNSSSLKSSKYYDQNCQKSQIRQKSLSQQNQQNKQQPLQNTALAQKILSNNKIANSIYEKSIIPEADPRSIKVRPQSVKTFKESRQGAGLNYVMAADEKCLFKQPERRHVEEYHAPRRNTYGKKCDLSATNQAQSSQIVSCMNEKTQNMDIHKINQSQPLKPTTNISSIFDVVHSSTTSKRISNDIHSSFTKKQSEDQNPPAKSKYESRDLFKTGSDLGYEYKKNKQLGCQKVMQMMGSQYHWSKKGNTESLRQKRDDWRRSTIVIQ